MYILFLKVSQKINLYKTETFEKKIYKYTVSKKYYEYQVKGLVYLSVYFIFRNIQRIYKVFSLPEISVKNFDIFLEEKYTEIILSITENDTVNYRIKTVEVISMQRY